MVKPHTHVHMTVYICGQFKPAYINGSKIQPTTTKSNTFVSIFNTMYSTHPAIHFIYIYIQYPMYNKEFKKIPTTPLCYNGNNVSNY